jgi:hypothetical protein
VTILRKALRLTWLDVVLLAEACVLLGAIRVALSVLPWRRAHVLIHSLRIGPPAGVSIGRLEWAVRNASRLVPRATCLTRAFALDRLLCRAGYQSSVQIGVAKEPSGRFVAHAWVEHDSQPLLDTTSQVARYSRLVRLGGEPPCSSPRLRPGALITRSSLAGVAK